MVVSVPQQRMRQLTDEEVTVTYKEKIATSSVPEHGRKPNEQWWVCEFSRPDGSWEIVAAYPFTVGP